MKLVFVCTGNTCRSPFAEAVARRERPDLDVSSAGVAPLEGAACPPEAVAAAAELGFDLRKHRARALGPETIASADLVVGMDGHHVQAVGARGGGAKARLLADAPILDPYGGDGDEYRARYAEIAAAVRAFLAELPARHTPPWVGKEVHPPPAASVPRTP